MTRWGAIDTAASGSSRLIAEAAWSSAAKARVPPQRGQWPSKRSPSAIEALFQVREQLEQLTAGDLGSMP